MSIITRKQYLNGEVSHHDYYAQFGKHLVSLVGSRFGIDRIKASTDPHFNDIPLNKWDNLAITVRMTVGRMLAEANGGGVSLSDCVCSAKAAAQIIREDSKK